LLLCIALTPAQTTLPGTQPLTVEGDFAALMVDGVKGLLAT